MFLEEVARPEGPVPRAAADRARAVPGAAGRRAALRAPRPRPAAPILDGAGARRDRRRVVPVRAARRWSPSCAGGWSPSRGRRRRIHSELFHVDPVPRGPGRRAGRAAEGAAHVTIRLDGRDLRVRRCGPTTAAVLEAALRVRSDLPFACKGGVCGTCRAKVVEGSVAMDVNYALEPDEVERGLRAHLPVAPDRRAGRARLRRVEPALADRVAGHGDPPPRPQRPEGHRDRVRQLDHPRLAGRGGRGDSPACAPPSTPASRPSTPPTSTPAPGPRPCSARRCRASAARAWRSSPRSTGRPARAANDRGLSRKHIMESINGSLRRLQTDYVDLYQAHRYDYETPLEETMEAFADVVRAGKALYIGVSEWTRRADPRRRTRWPASCSIPLVSNQPQYSMLWRVIEAEVVPDLRGARHRPDRLVADRAGRAHRQVPAGPAAAGGLARHRREGRRRHDQALAATTTCSTRVQQLEPLAEEAGLTHGPARGRLGAAEPERLRGDHRRLPARAGRRQRQGGRREARRRRC